MWTSHLTCLNRRPCGVCVSTDAEVHVRRVSSVPLSVARNQDRCPGLISRPRWLPYTKFTPHTSWKRTMERNSRWPKQQGACHNASPDYCRPRSGLRNLSGLHSTSLRLHEVETLAPRKVGGRRGRLKQDDTPLTEQEATCTSSTPGGPNPASTRLHLEMRP